MMRFYHVPDRLLSPAGNWPLSSRVVVSGLAQRFGWAVGPGRVRRVVGARGCHRQAFEAFEIIVSKLKRQITSGLRRIRTTTKKACHVGTTTACFIYGRIGLAGCSDMIVITKFILSNHNNSGAVGTTERFESKTCSVRAATVASNRAHIEIYGIRWIYGHRPGTLVLSGQGKIRG
jgi:hypothetical protein